MFKRVLRSYHETISINDIIADREGYILAYLSNENQEAVNVHFDDFTVYHGKTNVVSTQDYYPFGLTFNESQRVASKKNFMNTFQDQEYEEETGWVKFKWRNHQPEIGRFFNVDPLAEDYVHNSVYAFSENHVVAHRELEGLEKYQSNTSQQIADDQAMSTMYLNFRAASKNVASIIVGYATSGQSSSIVRKEYTVAADENGKPFINESGPFLQNKLSAGFFGMLDGLSMIPGGGPGGAMAKNNMKSTISGMTKDGLKKAQKSFTNLIDEHQKKLDDFLADPLGSTSPEKMKEMTKDNPTDEVLMERVMGRAKELESQINKQKGELKKIENQLDEIDGD